MKPNQHIRQGDVLLVRVPAIPDAAQPLPPDPKGRGVVLAEGEATGHAHAIRDAQKTQAYRDAEGFYLDVVDAPAQLAHPEHGAIALEAGTYRLIRQWEYRRRELARVAD